MSGKGITCPRCGYPASQIGKDTNEYTCNHCNATFVFYDAPKKMVTSKNDQVFHNCLYCGSKVKVGEGYKCAGCNDNFCENCVSEANGKYYCFPCVAKQWYIRWQKHWDLPNAEKKID